MKLEFVLNGSLVDLECPDNELLIDALRERFGLTATKRSCDVEVCGACAVLLDGLAVSACTTLAADADGRSVVTAEGLADGDVLNPVQQAFVDCAAVQCGFCTPGMVISVQALVLDHPRADEENIRQYLSGNICRCTGYTRILEAARRVLHE